MAANFCSKCGSPLKPGTKFCGHCGTKVIDNTAQNSNADNTTYQASAKSTVNNTQPKNQYTQSAKGPTSVIALIKASWDSNFSFSNTYKTEDERYNIFLSYHYFYLKFLIIASLICGVFSGLLESEFLSKILLELPFIIFLACSIKLIYSILKESDILPILIKMFIGLMISCLVFIPLAVLVPPVAVILTLISIYINRKRIQFLKKHKRYIYLVLKCNLIPIILGMVVLSIFATAIFTGNILLILPAIILFILAIVTPFMVYIRFIKREHSVYNVPFLSMLKLFTTVNLTFLCLLISFISLVKADVFINDSSLDFDGDFSGVAHAQANSNVEANDMHTNYTDTSTANIHPQTTPANNTNTDFNHTVHSNVANTSFNNAPANTTTSQNVDFNTPTKEATTTYQINDANNFQHTTVTMKDDGTGTITSDTQQNLGTVEQHNHTTVIKDAQGNVVSTKDNLTGHVTDSEGNPTGIASTNKQGPHSYYDTKTGTMTVEENGSSIDSKGNMGNVTKK